MGTHLGMKLSHGLILRPTKSKIKPYMKIDTNMMGDAQGYILTVVN